ncbi:MAG: beta strand repeat-containing protein, partial [Rhodoferax sp.]
GQEIAAMQCVVSPKAAPTARLSQSATGATSSETQHLAFSGSGMFQLVLGSARSAPLALTGLSASALQTALQGLSSIGSGNATVVAGANGGWDVRFTGALAAQDVASLQVLAVQTLDLRVAADALVADVVRLKPTAAADWAQTLSLTGLNEAAQVAALQAAIQALPGFGRNNASVASTGVAGVFSVVGAGALLGQSLPALTLGLSRAVQQPPNYLLIGATGVSASVGSASAGIHLSNLTVGLIISRDTPPVLGGIAAKPGYALVASGSAALQGFDSAVTLNASAVLQINTLGRAIDMAVKTGIATAAQQVTFSDALQRKEITIQSGTVSIAGLGSMTGQLKLVTTTQTLNGAVVTDLEIGVDNLAGSLSAGGVGATLAAGRGAIKLSNSTVGNNVTQKFAVAAEGNVQVTPITGVVIQASDLVIAYNRWGSDLTANVATASASYALNLVNNESRVRGLMHAEMGGALTIDGQMFIEAKTNQPVLLDDGSSVAVDQIIFGGAAVSAALGNLAVAARLSGTDIAVVLSTERLQSGTPRRWLTSKAAVGGLLIQALGEADITSASLDVNCQLGATGNALGTTGPVIDWNGASGTQSTAVALSPTQSVTLADGGTVFDVHLDGAIAFGPVQIGGAFDIALSQATDGSRSWTVNASNAHAALEAGGATVALKDGVGAIVIGPTGAKSGSIVGSAEVTGVSGLSVHGTLATRFDELGNMQLAGAIAIGVAGFADINGEFAVTKQATPTVADDVSTVRATQAAYGTQSTLTEGGLQTNSIFHLGAASSDGTRFREGSYAFGAGSATVHIDSTGQSDAAFATLLQTGLCTLYGSGNVKVTGTRAVGYAIEFIGALAGKSVTGLTMTAPTDPAQSVSWGYTSVISEAKAAASSATYSLLIEPPTSVGANSNNIGFKFANSNTTVTAKYTGIQATQYNRIRDALEQLVGVGNVAVTNLASSPSSAQVYIITLNAAALAKNLGKLSVSNAGADPILYTLTPQGDAATASTLATASVQTIDAYPLNVQGSFHLEFSFGGSTFTTAEVDAHASNATLRAALLAANGNGSASGKTYASLDGDADVSFNATSNKWTVSFSGAALGKTIPAMICTVSPLLAPAASLSSVTSGATTSELQQLQVQGSTVFALAFGSQSTAPLAVGSSAAQVQTALESLSTIGRGNVSVAAVTGGWNVSFTGALAAQNVAQLRFCEVQTLDLRLADGQLADVAQLRLLGAAN